MVTADPKAWRVAPFSAEIVDGSIYGRGALDMKGEGLLQLMTMIMLAREKPVLSRDVIFLATADEEVKDEGSLWMIANKAELFKNAEYLLTEGGDNLLALVVAELHRPDVALRRRTLLVGIADVERLLVAHALAQQGAVRQIGQRIVMGEVSQMRFRALACRDVERRGQHPP